MKKTIAVLAVLCMIFLCGCSEDEDASIKETPLTTKPAQTEPYEAVSYSGGYAFIVPMGFEQKFDDISATYYFVKQGAEIGVYERLDGSDISLIEDANYYVENVYPEIFGNDAIPPTVAESTVGGEIPAVKIAFLGQGQSKRAIYIFDAEVRVIIDIFTFDDDNSTKNFEELEGIVKSFRLIDISEYAVSDEILHQITEE